MIKFIECMDTGNHHVLVGLHNVNKVSLIFEYKNDKYGIRFTMSNNKKIDVIMEREELKQKLSGVIL